MLDGRNMQEQMPLEITVVSLVESVQDWDLVRKYMVLRREIFIEKLAWELTHASGAEFEQYDTPTTTYVVAHRGRKVVGGARLCRTSNKFGSGNIVYSYMIRDAVRGLLPSLPSNLCYEEPPVDRRVWELTRLISNDEPGVNQAVLEAANDFLFKNDGDRCLFLGPPGFMRMARKLKWKPRALGPIVGNVDGRFLAFDCPVRDPGRIHNI